MYELCNIDIMIHVHFTCMENNLIIKTCSHRNGIRLAFLIACVEVSKIRFTTEQMARSSVSINSSDYLFFFQKKSHLILGVIMYNVYFEISNGCIVILFKRYSLRDFCGSSLRKMFALNKTRVDIICIY